MSANQTGFMDQINLNHVYKLKKALYGLKQAPRTWYDLFSKFLLSREFSNGTMDPTLFIRRQGKDILLVQIYVDDIIFAIFEKYGMESSDPVNTPMVEKSKLDEDTQGKAIDPTHYHRMIGTLMYLTASRPDLTFAICMCARGTINWGLWYLNDSSIALIAYAYADYAGCQDTGRKYQLANIFTKALGRERIKFLINKLGMRIFRPKTLKQLADETEE
ncbi:retrovirus-related pol polyprotein from transposon TNT 1-94 [Tanacetum coccineum]|uniref:Retrovirus-related pol polyprotein from transposon TNT 1-94 n=1 Tax=Tanacetum coccineum TaxID=301880 RepID=A0ABQ4Y0H9_9ASTR